MSKLFVDEIQPKTTGGVITFQPNRPMFQVGLSSDQSIPNASTTQINWNDVQTSSGGFNVGSHFDLSNNWFKPTIAGYYFLVVQARIETSTPDYLQIKINKNGTVIRFHNGMESNSANAYVTAHTSSIVYMNGSSDYITVSTYHNSGSAKDILSIYGQSQFGGYLI